MKSAGLLLETCYRLLVFFQAARPDKEDGAWEFATLSFPEH